MKERNNKAKDSLPCLKGGGPAAGRSACQKSLAEFAPAGRWRDSVRGSRCAHRLAMTPFQEVRWVSLWCVGEGLCPSRGRGNRRSAAGGRRSEAVSRKCPDWRTRQWPSVGWHDGGQENPAPTEAIVGADDPVRPVPVTQHFVGQGPRALPLRRGKRIPQSWLRRASPL